MKIFKIIAKTLIFLILCVEGHSQVITYPNPNDSTIIQIKEFYKGYGKIFDVRNINQDFFPKCLMKPLFKTVQLTKEEIIKAEMLFLSNYGSNGKKKNKHSLRKNVKKFSDFYRQYVCHLNERGEKEVEIIFLGAKIILNSARHSDFIKADWKVCPQYGHGFSNNEMFRYWVNLDTEIIFLK
jgi:hypothetical protein